MKFQSAGVADAIGIGAVVAVITYASLIIGELVPKQIALHNPEAVAVRVAPAMTTLAKAMLPLVWILNTSGKAVLWLLRQHERPGEKVTEDEIRTLIAEAEHAGVLKIRREGDDRWSHATRRPTGARSHDAAPGG